MGAIIKWGRKVIKVIIFDFDDTLYSNANPLPWKNYCQRVIKYFASRYHKDTEEFLLEVKNINFSDRQLNQFLISLGAKQEEINKYYINHKPNDSTFNNCIVTPNSVLKEFKKSHKLYVVSNSLESSVRKNMETLGIDAHIFEQIVTNFNETKEESYRQILYKENILPNEVLVIGNSYHSDILPALNIGFYAKIINSANFKYSDFFDSENKLKSFCIKRFDGFMRGINFGLWLSQYKEYNIQHFNEYNTEQDVLFIKNCGFDHIRLPFDYDLFINKNFGFSYLDKFISWCEKYNLNVILDLHRMKGYSFNTLNKNTLFDNKNFQEEFISLWKSITLHFLNKGNNLCFELLNEVVLKDGTEKWNKLYKRTMSEIRKLDRKRIILIGSNMYSSPTELDNLKIIQDTNIVYTFHFYKPILFTHQKALWNEFANVKNQIPYPMEKDKFNNEMKSLGLKNKVETDINKKYLESYIRKAAEFAHKNNVICYCGEFGVIDHADQLSTKNWFTDTLSLFSEYNIGYAVWNYKEKQFKFQNFQTGKPNMSLFKMCGNKR